jgi:hypothetical protein
MVKEIIDANYEAKIIDELKKIFYAKTPLSQEDITELNNYNTEDYALLGIIGLLLNNKPRIILGRLQPYDREIREMCINFEIDMEITLKQIADKYLDDDYSEDLEIVLRKVMIEFPKKRKQ